MRYNIKLGVIVVLYIWITFLLYLVSPISYNQYISISYWKIILFLFFVSIFFFFGCQSIPICKNENINKNNYSNRFKYLDILILISIIIYISLIINANIRGMFHYSYSIGSIYSYRHSNIDIVTNSSTIVKISVLCRPLMVIALSLGAYNFIKFNFRKKLMYLIYILLIIIYNLFVIASLKEFGDVIIISSFSLFIRFLQENKLKKFIRIFLLVFIIFIIFFIYNQLSRIEAYGGSGFEKVNFFTINDNNIIYKLFGEKIGDGIIAFILYISHGYHGLILCLELPFECTYGLGSNWALSSYLEQYFGVKNLLYNTYPLRMETVYGWSGLIFWPTAFAWWASDISFYGVIFLMYFIGRFLCIWIKEAYLYNNPISITLSSFFFILVIFLPANNQLFQSRYSFITFCFLVIFWVFTRKKYNKLNTTEQLKF